ncbi:MAG TPA: tRNA (N6-threonylcarbamoyladenosine(37)-N6)-methyltransferase TrmO [Sedimentisphaerales bacterium]|nr:tRNA (N6-threonylcarbamoyladenosine(37)-N6)-methyltransferase TrmO [Sedimentisphaerales bacterium]HRS12201.1 tRNA (N6-threonylcarbamoyladenosine(37)-N6)-methyltransferase TrmO [Sedimentisphaerales bacterium]HRV48790.1 tRNA (N6-threonylcarbamoyladenosine(37)-N6)-methyltransferase TrmO [Sedimentisphaerales bacterium]
MTAEMTSIVYTPIGIIRSKHHEPEKTPIQPIYARGCTGRAEILPQYVEGLKDLDGFSHLLLLYHFHRAGEPLLTVVPFTDDQPRGLFATRSPRRPNPIGLSLVRLLCIEGAVLYLSNVDILDGTPLLDIKPYIPRFEQVDDATGGWTTTVDEETAHRRGRRGFQGGQP